MLFKPFPYKAFWYPRLLSWEGGEPTPSYLKNLCPHERETVQGIRDIFESLRNVEVVYIMFTWLP